MFDDYKETVEKLMREHLAWDVKAEPTRGGIFMKLPIAGGKTFQVALTLEQARYTSRHGALNLYDMAVGKFPDDWPK